MMFFEQAQVVIGCVKDQFAAVEYIEKCIQIDRRKRIHELVAVGGADLDETDFFRIGMEAVGFSIKRKPLSGAEFRQQGRKFYIIISHVRIILAN